MQPLSSLTLIRHFLNMWGKCNGALYMVGVLAFSSSYRTLSGKVHPFASLSAVSL